MRPSGLSGAQAVVGWTLHARRGWSWQSLALTGGVVVGLLWTLTAIADLPTVLRATAAILTRPDLLGVFVVSYSSAFALRAVAWRLLLADAPGVVRLFGFLQAALLANHVFPIKVGEAVRALLLVRSGVSASEAAASTLIARLLDLACLCGLAIGWTLLATDVGARLPAGLAVPLGLLLLGMASLHAVANGRAGGIWKRCPTRVANLGRNLEAALQAIPPRRVVLALLVTLPSWLLEALALWSVANAAGTPISLLLAVGATSFTIALQGLQVTPGGLGLYEASLTAALTFQGLDPKTALALAVATHAVKFGYAYGVGLVCLLLEALRSSNLSSRLELRATWGDSGAAMAVVAVVLAGVAYPGEVSVSGLGLASGALAIVPLIVLGKCHHLPRRLLPILLVPAGFAVVLFGRIEPLAALVALPIGGVALVAGVGSSATLLWAVVLTQVLLAGGVHPVEVALTCTLGSVGVVLVRQWWTSHHPLGSPVGLAANSLVAVVVPVHNELDSIGAVVAGVPRTRLAECGLRTLVLVVDDGSTDGSWAAATLAGADEVVRHPTRRGLGAALRSGLASARELGADAVVYLDADGEYDPAEMERLLIPLLDGTADYVLGVRFPSALGVMRPSRVVGNRLLTLLMMLLTGRRLADSQTGFRAFGPRALRTAEIIHDYNYAQVLTLDLLRKGMRLSEVPIGYHVRGHGRSFIRYHEYARRVLPAVAREILAP